MQPDSAFKHLAVLERVADALAHEEVAVVNGVESDGAQQGGIDAAVRPQDALVGGDVERVARDVFDGDDRLIAFNSGVYIHTRAGEGVCDGIRDHVG